MSKTAMPNGGDVQTLLVAEGMVSNPLTAAERMYDFDEFADAAVALWQKRTGWNPYLKDAADVTRYYDPPGPSPSRNAYAGGYRGGGKILQLDAGLLTLTSLKVGYSTTNPGTTLTQGVDFFLRPSNAAAVGDPWEWVEFRVPQHGDPDSIQMIGKWGRSATVPSDVWNRIRDYAAAGLACEHLGVSISKGMKSWKEADGTSETYNDDPLGAFVQRSIQRFSVACLEHKLILI